MPSSGAVLMIYTQVEHSWSGVWFFRMKGSDPVFFSRTPAYLCTNMRFMEWYV